MGWLVSKAYIPRTKLPQCGTEIFFIVRVRLTMIGRWSIPLHMADRLWRTVALWTVKRHLFSKNCPILIWYISVSCHFIQWSRYVTMIQICPIFIGWYTFWSFRVFMPAGFIQWFRGVIIIYLFCRSGMELAIYKVVRRRRGRNPDRPEKSSLTIRVPDFTLF